jgi:hypothetical protein
MKNEKRQLLRCLKVTALALTLILFSQFSFAGNFEGSMSLSLGSPRGEMSDYIDNTAFGVSGTLGINLGKSPFLVGVDLGYLNYGNDRRYDYLHNYPHIGFTLKHSYNILQSLAFLRFQPIKKGTVSPYIDGLLGVSYFWTATSLENDFEDESVHIETNQEDAALAYGVGGGLKIKLGSRKKKHLASGEKYFIDLRFRYLFGGKVEYLTKGSILSDEFGTTYFLSESRSDLFSVQIGFGAYL